MCGDGSASLAPTPAPVVSEPSVCGVVVVTGTSEAASIDGLYYADGTDTDTGVSQYNGYDVDGTRCVVMPRVAREAALFALNFFSRKTGLHSPKSPEI